MFAAVPLFMLAAAWSSPGGRGLAYVLTPLPDEGRLRVEITWDDPGRRASRLAALERWGSVDDVPGLLSEVTFDPPATARQEGRRWIITHPVGKPVVCRYTVKADHPDGDWSYSFHPLLTRDYFHGIGATFLLTPELPDGQPRDIPTTLRWELPKRWRGAVCSWGTGPACAARMTASDLTHSVYLAGDLTLVTRTVMDRPLTVALRDKFAFDADALADLAAGIIEDERRFMEDRDFPPYLVTAIPLGEVLPRGSSRLQGTGLYRSFAAFAAPKATLGEPIEHLFAHELFHYWNGRILDREPPPERVYWFSEGFTDYFALRILYASGRWNASRFAEWINRHVAGYFRNPARNATNDDIQRNFWRQRETVGEIAYQRGCLLALRWHFLARQHGVSGGVDLLFRALVHRAQETGFRISNERLRDEGVNLLGEWFGPDFDRFVTRAETIELPADALAPDFTGTVKPIYSYDPGFDETSYADKRVRGLKPGSSAEQAGLRDGDELLGWDVRPDPDFKAKVTVRRGALKQTIAYYPRGERYDVLQFSPARRTATAPTESAASGPTDSRP